MSSLSGKITYPLLGVDEHSRLPRSALRLLTISGSMAAALALHLVLFFICDLVSKRDPQAQEEPSNSKQRFVVVEPQTEPTPPPPPSDQLEAVGATNKPKETAQPKDPATKEKKTPKKSSSKATDADEFMDLGSLGGVDLGVTGPGGSSFKVAIGEGAAKGAIARSSKLVNKPSSTNTERSSAPAKRAPRAVSVRDLSRKAKPNSRHNRRLKAPYPQELRREGIIGEVQAVLTILKDGTVGKVKILRSAHPAFSKAALPILKAFLFEPAIDKRGTAVISKIKLTYRFTLQ